MLSVGDFGFRRSAVFVHSGPDRDHDIDNIHHGFLVSRGVVPSDWEKARSEATPYYSEILYENGMTLSADEDYIRVMQSGGLEFGKKYESVELVTRYLVSFEQDKLGNVVMRWDLDATHDSPGEWIGETLVHPRVIEGGWDDLTTHLTFHIDFQENSDVTASSMFFTFSTSDVEDDSGEKQGQVNITCGVRRGGVGDNDELIRWLSGWREHERFILDALGSLLGVDSV